MDISGSLFVVWWNFLFEDPVHVVEFEMMFILSRYVRVFRQKAVKNLYAPFKSG